MKKWISACVVAAFCGMSLAASVAVNAERDWDLRDLYADMAAWNAGFERNQAAVRELGAAKGSLNSADSVYKFLDTQSAVRREFLRLYVYASLIADTDVRVAGNQERRQRVSALGTEIDEQTAWLAPEILALGAEKVRGFLQAHSELRRRFDFQLNEILRGAAHTLSTEGEGVLAAAGNLLQQPGTLHSEFSNGEIPFPVVKLGNGQSVQLNAAAYELHRQSANRADRKRVFESWWGSWKKYEATLGNMLASQVMADAFSARARKFPNALESALFPDNMPVTVYRTLVAEANKGLPTLHRYLRLRKRELGISDELRYHDNYPPLFPLAEAPTFTVAAAKRLTLAALQPLGTEYLAELERGFAGAWMSVFPATGKRSGAYMSGAAYDVHPYLLLNHNGDYDSVSTFAHEWGHAVHTQLTRRAQPFEKADYSTFTAESASIGNQMLLNDYMVANARSRAEKLHYLGQSVDDIRTTFFRQVMFAEFELAVHEAQAQGQALSGARMTTMYCELLRKYYGEATGVMKIDPAYCLEWSYIPHFYYNFYLYLYATSMAGAAWLTSTIATEGASARERFLDLLRAGGSDYPYELYKRAGLDMATAAPYQALVARMNRLLDEIEALQQQGRN